MAMCHLLGAPGEHNPARVFPTMQAHLRAWPPLGQCGAGPCVSHGGPHGPLWAGLLWQPLGPCSLRPCGRGRSSGGPPWAIVGRALVAPLGPCGPGPLNPHGLGRIYIGMASMEYLFPLFIFLSTA